MASFDPLLFVALAAGFLLGRSTGWRPAWLGTATFGTVVALVALLGASLSSTSPASLFRAVPLALAIAGLLLATTGAVALGLRRSALHRPPPSGAAPRGRWAGVALLGVLAAGYSAGRLSGWRPGSLVDLALYAMLALVAFQLSWSRAGLRRLWVPVTAAVAGALGTATLLVALHALPLRIAFATTLGFGWYTLTGPLVAAQAGEVIGFTAFLANFLRENLTMVTAPAVGPRLGGEGLTALGGATSMDTTLYFVTRYGSADSASLALASGLILTVAAAVAVPLVLVAGVP